MNQLLSQKEVTALKQELFTTLHCAMPGIVVSFDPETQTAVVCPADPRMPLLRDVPVFMPVPFDVHPGDACLLVFADFDTDAWFASEEAAEPQSGRRHSLSDAFAFVGFKRRDVT